MSLWGNKCDLSISGGDDNAQVSTGLHKNLESFSSLILVNNSSDVWKHLETGMKSGQEVILTSSVFRGGTLCHGSPFLL